jgi:predicted nucleotidyltransferase
MNVGSPISSVIPTLDGPVLEVLSGVSSPLTLSQIHRRATRGTLSGISLVLGRLTREGIVHDVPGGYLLNRDHVASEAIGMLAKLHGLLVRRLRAEVKLWEYEPEAVGLFGSAARRDGNSESDIDILIIGKTECPEDLVSDLMTKVMNWTGNRTQVVSITSVDLKRFQLLNEPILEEWRRDIEVIAGDPGILDRVCV